MTLQKYIKYRQKSLLTASRTWRMILNLKRIILFDDVITVPVIYTTSINQPSRILVVALEASN